MISDKEITLQLPFVLENTQFGFLGSKYEGKVRDNYVSGDTRYLITTDRLSCFDVVVTTVPFKGQVLNQIASHWFEISGDIVGNHLLDVPDPNVMVVKNCQVLPVEIIVRAYITGSAWRDYEAGKTISGVKLPPGLKASQKLPATIITPSTKAAKGDHDMPISEEEILSKGLVKQTLWDEIKEVSLALFGLGQAKTSAQGLILVDTKYEFGLSQGKLTLVDEVHTLDSSRYWVAATYQERFSSGQSPEMLDKEPTRQWLLSKGYKGEGAVPEFTKQHRVEISRHYIDSYQKITGTEFKGEVGSVSDRIRRNLEQRDKRAKA